MSKSRTLLFSALLASVLLLFSFARSQAADSGPTAGWEKGSPYNQLYKADELDKFKGIVVSIKDITPMPGMAPGVGLNVRDQDGDLTEVQLGPKDYVHLDSLALRDGDKITVRGSWAEIDGKDVFLASKIKKGENEELKLRRTKDGTPYWTMTQEEIAKEKEEK